MSRVQPWVKNLVEDVFGNPESASFRVGKRVTHPDGRTVEITGGQFWGQFGLSNFWEWREVMPDGSLSEHEESGYGW